jgi:hypothetical protein
MLINVTWTWGTQCVERGRTNPRFPYLRLPEVIPYDYKNKDKLHRLYSVWQHIVSTVGLWWVSSP